MFSLRIIPDPLPDSRISFPVPAPLSRTLSPPSLHFRLLFVVVVVVDGWMGFPSVVLSPDHSGSPDRLPGYHFRFPLLSPGLHFRLAMTSDPSLPACRGWGGNYKRTKGGVRCCCCTTEGPSVVVAADGGVVFVIKKNKSKY